MYFLDRNAISIIKESLGKNIVDREKKNKLQYLKSLDKRGNAVASIYSILEGQSGIKELKEEMENTLDIEIKAMSKFYNRAKTDSSILEETRNDFINIFSTYKRVEQEDAYKEIIRKLWNDKHYNPVSKKDRKMYLTEFIQFSKGLKISVGHPIVVCCLALLCGNSVARKILKIKKNLTSEEIERAIYNSYNDLIIISELATVKAHVKEMSTLPITIEFVTFDKALEVFISFATFDSKLIKDGNRVSCKYKPELFSDLDDDEYEELMQCMLENSQTGNYSL
jgi:hypothetical protein